MILLLAAAFVGCKPGNAAHSGHEHNEKIEHEEHAGHDHGDHEGHDHSTESAEEHAVHDHGAETAEATHDGEITFTRKQAEAAGLTTETVTAGAFAQVIKAGGVVESPLGDEAVVAATASGIVSLATLTEGAPVSKGARIASISARNIVDGDAAGRARIELQAAESAYKRAETLAKDNIVSQKDFEEARRRYETARAALPAGGGTTAVSPLTGFVKSLLVRTGEYVAIGQPIAVVVQSNTLQLRAEVSERYFGALPGITGANFRLSYGGEVRKAERLVSRGRAASDFVVPVIFEFANVGDVLPGAYAEVWLLGALQPEVLSVPRGALTEEQGLYFVYVQLGDEIFAKREVTVGADNGKRVSVVRGLSNGEVVVASGAMQVRLAAMSGIIPEGHSHSH